MGENKLFEDKIFDLADQIAQIESTCLKIKTAAVIIKNNEIAGIGWNVCSPDGFNHGKPVKKCLRLNMKSGENYELCKSIHAEITAIIKTGKKKCKGAVMYLSGHHYACWQCESVAKFAGIKEIKIKDKKAFNFYLEQNSQEKGEK